MKVMYGSAKKPELVKKINAAALTNYNLLLKLEKSCEEWENLLKETMGQITLSQQQDLKTVELLEQYICAGYIARERIGKEVLALEERYKDTNMSADIEQYKKVNAGLKVFDITLANLEKSKAMGQLSMGQLDLIKESNVSLQIALKTQKANSMNLASQQIRNAVLNQKNKQALEGQKMLKGLNDELLRKVSKDAVYTAEEAQQVIYSGFYSIEAAQEAAQTVVEGCKHIQQAGQELLPKMKEEAKKIQEIMDELKPEIEKLNSKSLASNVLPSNTKVNNSTSSSSGGLKF